MNNGPKTREEIEEESYNALQKMIGKRVYFVMGGEELSGLVESVINLYTLAVRDGSKLYSLDLYDIISQD